LGLYTGARPNELTLLEGRDLLFEEKLLVIRPEISKTRKKRFPELPDNAIAWLKYETDSYLPNRKIVQLTEAQIIYARKQCYHAVVGISLGLKLLCATDSLPIGSVFTMI
jgi:integrase